MISPLLYFDQFNYSTKYKLPGKFVLKPSKWTVQYKGECKLINNYHARILRYIRIVCRVFNLIKSDNRKIVFCY